MTTNIARVYKLTLAWILSLVAVGAVASVLTSAQARSPLGRLPMITADTTILSGPDIGFRVERTQDGVPIGTLVIRVDGGRHVRR